MQYEKILDMRWKSHNVSCASQAELIMQRMVSACRQNGTSAVSVHPILVPKKVMCHFITWHYLSYTCTWLMGYSATHNSNQICTLYIALYITRVTR